MTYSSGSIIEASDYNNFVSASAAGNTINKVWSTGSTDSGWGQTALANVVATSQVTATSWASLVLTLAQMGLQTNTTLTSRTVPVTGNIISILANVQADINSCTTNRGNTGLVGSLSSTWTGNVSYTPNISSGNAAWRLRWEASFIWSNANELRYFWNAGGRIQINMSKTSTGLDSDSDWNSFVGKVGTLTYVGRVNANSQNLANTVFTGTTRTNGTGGTETLLASTTGYYNTSSSVGGQNLFTLVNDSSPYTGDQINLRIVRPFTSSLIAVVDWISAARTGPGQSTAISGGTATTSPFTSFGTAPAVIFRTIPPSTAYLTQTWGAVVPSVTVTLT